MPPFKNLRQKIQADDQDRANQEHVQQCDWHIMGPQIEGKHANGEVLFRAQPWVCSYHGLVKMVYDLEQGVGAPETYGPYTVFNVAEPEQIHIPDLPKLLGPSGQPLLIRREPG